MSREELDRRKVDFQSNLFATLKSQSESLLRSMKENLFHSSLENRCLIRIDPEDVKLPALAPLPLKPAANERAALENFLGREIFNDDKIQELIGKVRENSCRDALSDTEENRAMAEVPLRAKLVQIVGIGANEAARKGAQKSGVGEREARQSVPVAGTRARESDEASLGYVLEQKREQHPPARGGRSGH
jgi:hypothetical protein